MFELFLKWISEKPIQRSLGTAGGGASIAFVLFLHQDVKAYVVEKIAEGIAHNKEYVDNRIYAVEKDLHSINEHLREIRRSLEKIADRQYERRAEK